MAALAKKEAFGEAVIRKALSVVASGGVFCWALIGIPFFFFFLFLACFSRTCCSLVWRALCPLQGGLRARRPAMSYGDCWVARVKWWVSFVPFFFFFAYQGLWGKLRSVRGTVFCMVSCNWDIPWKEALREGCVVVDSPRSFFVRQVSLVHSVIRILSFLHNAAVSFMAMCWQVGRYLSEFQPSFMFSRF